MKKVSFKSINNTINITSSGEWTVKHIPEIEKMLSKISKDKNIYWDVSDISKFDSSGILILIKFKSIFKHVEFIGFSKKQKEMYDILNTDNKKSKRKEELNLFQSVGKKTVSFLDDLNAFSIFIGHVFSSILYNIFHPKNIRIKEMTYHIQKSGMDALFIIALTSFLIGMVIAYQGAVQLSKFGADIFIVDTVGISIVRELGPMITAIVIAGRSGSAYTAEIGAMKITEEISAMKTMGFDTFNFLVLPRIFALMIALPLLIFIADIMGIFGGMVAAQLQLNISFTQFTERLSEVLELKQFFLGMIKAPVFAFVIAGIGCFRGLLVSDNTESLGQQTTLSVVNGIFLVIAFDAVFSIIYTGFGV